MENLTKQERKRVLAFALFAGEVMLTNGAETHRVEDTIRRICSSRGLSYVTSFVTPTVIMIGDDRNDGYSFMKRIAKRSTNFERISMANEVSRSFVSGTKTLEQANRELRLISMKNSYPTTKRIFWCGVASSMFAYLFGGTLWDMICGLVVSMIAIKTAFVLDRYEVNQFLQNAICSTIIAVLAVILADFSLGNRDMIIAAAIMPLLPGFSLTNGIRDFIAGDLISGVSRAFEAFLIAVSIAVSIGSVLSLFHRWGGGM